MTVYLFSLVKKRCVCAHTLVVQKEGWEGLVERSHVIMSQRELKDYHLKY